MLLIYPLTFYINIFKKLKASVNKMVSKIGIKSLLVIWLFKRQMRRLFVCYETIYYKESINIKNILLNEKVFELD